MRLTYAIVCAALAGVVSVAAAAVAQERPLSVTYGPKASAAEGDPDFREVIFFRVPEETDQPLFFQVFDPDLGGDHDMVYGAANTRTRFTLYGGTGAATMPPLASGELGEVGDEQRQDAGTVLADKTVGEDAALDNKWHTLARVMPDEGERVDGHYVFRLVVSGLDGDDANLFSATASLRESRVLPPEGLDVFSFAPTVRVPDKSRLVELRFVVPADADSLTVRNFDAARGTIAFASTDRTVDLAASNQNEWRESTIPIRPEERNALAAVQIAGGDEIPNDITIEVVDGAGARLPIRLPARAWIPNGRPIPEAEIALLADCGSVAFDALPSSDPDGDSLSYRWDFGDGGSSDAASVVHRYAAPGGYEAVLRLIDSSGQIGSGAFRAFDVFVRRSPVADAGEQIVVAPGTSVTFDGNNSQPGDRPIARYTWDFRDGGRADGAAVAHTFAAPGRYDVTLHVEEAEAGPCTASVAQRTVRVNAPPVPEAGPDQRVAIDEPLTLDGSASYDPDGKILSYAWDLGDGTRASGPVARHAYATPGTYPVALTVRDDAGVANSSRTANAKIVVNAPPEPVAGPDRLVAVGEVIDFDGSGSSDADGAILEYLWHFGDGSSGRGLKVPYAYRQSGSYQVTLTVRDNSNTASETRSDTLTVRVNEPPVADAGEDQLLTASAVRFDGARSRDPDGAVSLYAWDFGDGATGLGPTPTHVYRKPGTYRVTLTVTDDSGTRNGSASDTTRVIVNAAPIADAGPDQVAVPGQMLTFDGSRSVDPDGDVTESVWDFRDGGTASGARVTHAFERPGVYQVLLTVSDDTGHPEAIDYDEAVVVINAPPVADAGPDRLAAPGDEVVFDAVNAFDPDGRIERYSWDFSDGHPPATARRVVRSYPAPGVYTARLTVTDDSAVLNAAAQDQVSIRINHQPVASAGPDIRTSTTTVRFDATQSADADGDALTYSWDFGDGSPPATGAEVIHVYAEGGRYPVVLTVDDGTGLHNATSQAALTVAIDRPPLAVAGSNMQACAGDIVVFDGSRSSDPEGGLLRYAWEFGDQSGAGIVNPTKMYTDGGVYPVTLTVEDESGFATNRHTDRIAVRVDEAPLAVAGPDQTVCANKEVYFDGSESRDFDGVVNRFIWDFGDSTVGGGERPVHAYARPGDYRVVLTIEGDQAGQCDNTASDEMTVRVVEAPVARISAPLAVAEGRAASFDATASTTESGRIVAWTWDFGDGATAEGARARHTYQEAGTYVASLTLETEDGVPQCKSVTALHSIVVNAAPVAVADGPGQVGIGEEVLFDGAASRDPDGGITSYAWDFGDGNEASGINVRHRFRASGRYPVRLTVTDDTTLPNRSTTTVIDVAVNDPPKPMIAAPVAGCPGEGVAFSGGGSTDAEGVIHAFMWDFGDGVTASGPEVSHRYAAPGFYGLTLRVDDGAGLNNSIRHETLRFHVNQPPEAEAGPDRLVCAGDDIAFDGSASIDWDGNLVSYLWDFGDGTTAEGRQPSHRFAVPGIYDVALTVDDGSGASCARVVDVARVTVNASPVARAGGDREVSVDGAHDVLTFDGSRSEDADGEALRYVWELGDGSTQTGGKIRHRYAEAGDYTVRLTVSDGSGLHCGQGADVVTVAARRRE